MKKNKGEGYFYRRRGSKYIAIDDNKVDTIYYCVSHTGYRRSICMYTSNIKVAEQRAKKFSTSLEATSEQKYLRSLVKLGKWAEKKLEELM